ALRPDTPPDGDTSEQVATRVSATRQRQLARGRKPNARLSTREINRHCKPDAAGQQLLERAMEQLGLSARAYHRILKVARTIADLAGSETVMSAHVAEAVGYRVLDRHKALA
ncbi:MAG: ATP-dependent protease, partial [Gammaproteobacteria bacterium]